MHPMRQAGAVLKPFICRQQALALGEGLAGEEGEFFETMITKLAARIDAMPKTYEQEALGDKAIVYLHYFKGSGDWFITEKDREPEQLQAFGLADLGYGGELGYISIEELKAHNVELDLYWTPMTLGEVCAQREAA